MGDNWYDPYLPPDSHWIWPVTLAGIFLVALAVVILTVRHNSRRRATASPEELRQIAIEDEEGPFGPSLPPETRDK